jgi:glycosyltransferase involved in cell wall biosynthesis
VEAACDLGSRADWRSVRLASRDRLSLGVVVLSHNSSWQLYGVLRSLDCQSVRPETVVVVDDGSDPWEQRRVRSLCRDLGTLCTRVPPPRSRREALGRRSAARNLGTKCLDTDVILYLDGDMLLGPKYIEEIRRYHDILGKAYIRGRRYGISAADQANGIEFCLDAIAKKQLIAPLQSVGYTAEPQNIAGTLVCGTAYRDRWEWCASNNLSVRSEYVAKIGYWDEGFLGWGEEDIDFSLRLHRLGLTPLVLETDDAAAYHLDHQVDHETNTMTLRENGKYLIGKFPGVEGYRDEAYAQYGINIEDLSRRRSLR